MGPLSPIGQLSRQGRGSPAGMSAPRPASGLVSGGRGRQRRRAIALAMALLGGAGLLAGCGRWGERTPVVLFLAIGTLGNEAVSRDNTDIFQRGYLEVLRRFRQIHPNVMVRVAVYRQALLAFALSRRQRSGLGPDLIATSADEAHALLRRGLAEPIPLGARQRAAIAPALLQRVTDRQGRVFAQPLVVLAQLACYDKRRLAEPPASVRELLRASAAGAKVGLAIDPRQLFWSAGSLGALPAIRTAAVAGAQPDQRQMDGLRGWMQWLQAAQNQSRLSFLDNEQQLRQGLIDGQLDWITCRSGDLKLLQGSMGRHLGVAALPNGDGFQASPVSLLRVLVLGRGSSPRQRQLAIDLAHFSLNPLMQRSLIVENLGVLPVNRYVSVPVSSSHMLAALQVASRQSMEATPVLTALHAEDPRVPRLREVLAEAIFAEITPEQAAQRLVSILRRRP
jgi:arabinogalactan oligomer/maltooligosaccharide transport system substrate-binding protein